MTSTGRIVQLSVSPGGVPKTAVESARVTAWGLEGDAHRDRAHHGGPDRAVCLYALEPIAALRREGHDVVPGALGENVTIEGLDWDLVQPERHLLLGDDVLVQVTRFTTPCFNIKPVFLDGDSARISHRRHPGWSRVYARVLRGGDLRRGDAVRLLSPAEAERAAAR